MPELVYGIVLRWEAIELRMTLGIPFRVLGVGGCELDAARRRFRFALPVEDSNPKY